MVHLQKGETCGNMNEDCCYGSDDAALCAVGACAPRNSEETDIKEIPCMCSETICVRNVDYCPDGAVCPQSAVEKCGQEGDPCCNGISCDEEVSDGDSDEVAYDLLCNQDFFDKDTGQSTRCEKLPEILDQSFDGCGNAFEKCCGGERCDDDEFECRCMVPSIYTCSPVAVWSRVSQTAAVRSDLHITVQLELACPLPTAPWRAIVAVMAASVQMSSFAVTTRQDLSLVRNCCVGVHWIQHIVGVCVH